MSVDAILMAMLAVLDILLIAYLRKRHARRVRDERMAASLRIAIHRENGIDLTMTHRLRRAGEGKPLRARLQETA